MARQRHSGITEQRKASIRRLEDAEVLLTHGRWQGAMYLAGYAVECRLKYKLMQMWQCVTLKQLEVRLQRRQAAFNPFTHSLRVLLRVAGGLERLQANGELWGRFAATVNAWQPAWRYRGDLGNAADAADFWTASG